MINAILAKNGLVCFAGHYDFGGSLSVYTSLALSSTSLPLLLEKAFGAILIASKLTQALLLDQYLLLLLVIYPWVFAPLLVAVMLFILLGRWAHDNQEYERAVLTLRREREKQMKEREEIDKELGEVIVRVIEPRLPAGPST